jgi:hypothetical protein
MQDSNLRTAVDKIAGAGQLGENSWDSNRWDRTSGSRQPVRIAGWPGYEHVSKMYISLKIQNFHIKMCTKMKIFVFIFAKT